MKKQFDRPGKKIKNKKQLQKNPTTLLPRSQTICVFASCEAVHQKPDSSLRVGPQARKD